MEPSNATTSPVVERCSLIIPKRIDIDSTFGLKDKASPLSKRNNYITDVINAATAEAYSREGDVILVDGVVLTAHRDVI